MNDISKKIEPDFKDEKIKELELKIEEYLNGWKRAKADYINLKKETEQRQKQMAEFALVMISMKIIPVADNLNKAFGFAPEDAKQTEWFKGIENTKKQLENILNELGLEKIKTIGEKFNPVFHEAVAFEKKDGITAETIFEEVSAGYLLQGKTVVAAKVKVAR